MLDGLRYPSTDPTILSSYFTRMRAFFMKEAQQSGFETVDMDDHFIPRFKARNERYEFPTDGHWNSLGHGMVAAAIQKSALFARRQNAVTPLPASR